MSEPTIRYWQHVETGRVWRLPPPGVDFSDSRREVEVIPLDAEPSEAEIRAVAREMWRLEYQNWEDEGLASWDGGIVHETVQADYLERAHRALVDARDARGAGR